MLNTRRIIWTMLTLSLATLAFAATGCHVARKPVALIEPTFSYLDRANNGQSPNASPRFQVAAFADSDH